MMKNKVVVLLCVLSLISISACAKQDYNYETKMEETSMQLGQTDSNNTETKSVVSEEELLLEERRFKDLLNSLDPSCLTKVRIDKLDRNTTKNYSFFSEDPKIIMQWIDLLRKMKTSVAQDNYLLGYNGFSLAFYNGENVIPICGMMMQYIYTGTEGTMHVVDNYSELEGEFDELLKQIVPEELLSQ